MSEGLILAIDQGTTNTKAVLVDGEGRPAAEASCPVGIAFPRPGWVEQDPIEIWRSVGEAVDRCLAAAGRPRIAAVAIANQRESVVAWERATGAPIGPLVSWQCRRGGALCEALRHDGWAEEVLQRTGLTLDPMFSASKMRWLLDHCPDGRERAARGEICLGTVDSWLLWNLTGGRAHRCDLTNASRTLLFNIRTLDWDDVLLEAFGVPRAALPAISYSSAPYGEVTTPTGAPFGAPVGALTGTPIGGMIGDSHGAMYAHGRYAPGAVKATYGTGSSLMSPVDTLVISRRGLSTTIGWADHAPVYALEGNIYVTGAAVQWARDLLGLDETEALARLATTVPDTEGLYLVPAFVGLGAPHWDDGARGLLTGLTRGSGRAHVARAAIESISYQIRDVFDVIAQESASAPAVLLADGGASRNDMLMQFQADILDCPVVRNRSTILSALGAAYLAGLTVGVWASRDEIAALPRPTDRFEPRMGDDARGQLYAGWRKAVSRTVFRP